MAFKNDTEVQLMSNHETRVAMKLDKLLVANQNGLKFCYVSLELLAKGMKIREKCLNLGNKTNLF